MQRTNVSTTTTHTQANVVNTTLLSDAARQQPANAPALLAELKHADAIIKAMLNAMTGRQKVKVHEQLDRAGVSNEGMTRHHERAAVIEAATAQAAPTPVVPDDVREVLDAVLDGTVDMDIAVTGIRQLTGLALEKCTDFGNATAVNALIRAALRHADDIENHVRWERTCVKKVVAASQIGVSA